MDSSSAHVLSDGRATSAAAISFPALALTSVVGVGVDAEALVQHGRLVRLVSRKTLSIA